MVPCSVLCSLKHPQYCCSVNWRDLGYKCGAEINNFKKKKFSTRTRLLCFCDQYSGRPKRNNFGISVVSFRLVSFRFGSVRSRYTETELLSSFLPYFLNFYHFQKENPSIFMKQNIGSKTNKIQMISQIFFGQKILQRGSILNIKYAQFRFGNFGFGSVNLTEISISIVSVFTCFGRPLSTQ